MPRFLKMLWYKIRESMLSVLPVTIIILILSFTPCANLTGSERGVFIISSILLILGMGMFNLGADLAMTPMGEQIGSSLIKSKKIKRALLICFIMGLLITIAEPDLSVLAEQVSTVINNWTLIITVGIGVGVFLVLALIKIILKVNLSMILMYCYLAMFCVAALLIDSGNGSFLALAFDSGGVTTGPITVPFIMALGLGVARTIGGRDAKENSFGLIALCSVGPILVVLILCLTINSSSLLDTMNKMNSEASTNYLMGSTKDYFLGFLESAKDVGIALSLIVIFFLIINHFFIKLSKNKLTQIFIGIAFTFFGLILFLTAASKGFLPAGYKIGYSMANYSKPLIIIFSFILGCVVVLAEPAVHVLTKQVEEVTTGTVKKRTILIALSIGVGISICLSVIRIIFKFSILYYLIPGYLISLGLSFFVPKMYTAIAFDSGGVASGPLTSSFILPFAIGACVATNGNILELGFGIVAMVALTPLITIQLLGFKSVMTSKVVEKRRLKQIVEADDCQIINFM